MITVISYPSNEINYSIATPETLDSAELVKYLWVDVSEALTDEYVEVTYKGETRTFIIEDECRYEPIDIAFQNKDGAVQILTFFKARKDSINIESEQYESDRAQLNHQFVKYNVKTKEKLSVNTGFLTEDKNDIIKQLLQSERVWIVEAQPIPLNVSTTSQEYKTRVNDRLINYNITFDFAFYGINNL